MSYYRPRVPPWLWAVLIALALAAALWLAGWATVDAVRARERAAVLAEGAALTQAALARGDALARERDSLRAVTARVDTVWRRARETARQAATAPVPAGTDTAALVATVISCRATLTATVSACDSLAAVHRAALDQADTTRRADSTARSALALQLAAIRRADSVRAAQSSRRSRLRIVADGVCAGAVAAHLFQWSTR